MKHSICLIFLLWTNMLLAQSTAFSINFRPIFAGKAVVYEEDGNSSEQDDIHIETLKFLSLIHI